MPSYYWFHCSGCDWRQRRYRNLKRCPICGADAIREEPVSEVEQLRIKATELQARLDTHRQQTRMLVRERDALQEQAHLVVLAYRDWQEGLLNSEDEMILQIKELEEAL